MLRTMLVAICLTGPLCAQWGLRVTLQTEDGSYKNDEDKNETYTQQWLDLSLNYGAWNIGARYERYDPAKPQSILKEGEGLWTRFVEYRKPKGRIRLGTFHTIFGRGLVLNTYEYAALGLDRRLDGLLAEYEFNKLEVTALAGDIYGIDREKNNSIGGGQLRFKPSKWASMGGSYVQTDMRFEENVAWYSFFAEAVLDWGGVYLEQARGDRASEALYGSFEVYLGEVVIAMEYKDYDRFDRSDSHVIYNDPPTLVKEHSFVLWNRHNYVLSAFDEVGYLAKVDAPLPGDVLLSMQHCNTSAHDGFDIFTETFAHLEWDWHDTQWEVIAGTQTDFSYDYTNVGTDFRFPIKSQSMGIVVELQQNESLYIDEAFDSQAVTLDYSPNSRHTISVVGEHSNSTESDKTTWLGAKYTAHIGRQLVVDVFAGTRRKGKVCAGGICVYTPEFDGFEMKAKYQFQR